MRLLSDPLKLKLVQCFAEEDRTAAEVAKLLEQPVTRLYRHVDALLDAGIIAVVSETPKRGTVERRFRTTARRFEVDQSLFSSDAGGEGDDLIRDVFQTVQAEVSAALAEPGDVEPTLARLTLKGSPERINALQQELIEWLEQSSAGQDEATGDEVEAGALIAFYRLPSS